MFLAGLPALVLLAQCTNALRNSSPLFLYSTANLSIPSIQDLSPASTVQSVLSGLLSQCPTTHYLVVLQSGVSASDYICPKNTPFIRERIATPGKDHSGLVVRDVVDSVDAMALAATIERSCNKGIKIITSDRLSYPNHHRSQLHDKVIYTSLPSIQSDLSIEDRKIVLQQHDNYLSSMVESYFGDKDYTLVYVTESVHAAGQTEQEVLEYAAEVPLAEVVHAGELIKRTLAANKSHSSNQTIIDGPLFEKYQFFTPGIFMGLLVGFILLSILYVGISALTSLQVTYGAFDKEQGQLANKKQ